MVYGLWSYAFGVYGFKVMEAPKQLKLGEPKSQVGNAQAVLQDIPPC